jgi:sulfur-carrier protein
VRVTVLYFAALRQAIGRASEQRETLAATVGQLRDELLAEGSTYAALAHGKAVRMALNQVMCADSAVLLPGAEVAFFPPVTGG